MNYSTDTCLQQPDELVEVLVPHVGTLVVKVLPHSHDDVIRGIPGTLSLGCFNEVGHLSKFGV